MWTCTLRCFSCVQLFVILWTVAHQPPYPGDTPGKMQVIYTLKYKLNCWYFLIFFFFWRPIKNCHKDFLSLSKWTVRRSWRSGLCFWFCFLQRPLLILSMTPFTEEWKTEVVNLFSILVFWSLAMALYVEPGEEPERSAPSAGNICHGRIL